MTTLSRRAFNQSLVAGVAGLTWSNSILSKDTEPKISLSTWSFHNYFPHTRYGNPQFKLEEWKLEDVVQRTKDQLGITAFELSSAHLASWETQYLDQLKRWMEDQKCQFIHLSDNIRGINLARSDRKQREADLQKFKELIDVAHRLGIPSMRVNTGRTQNKDWDMSITFDCYKRLAEYGATKKVEIIVENHFGISADPKNVVKIIKEVGKNISACPDFGLFKKEENRWPGLKLLFQHCRHICSAKFHGFNEQGKHSAFDLKRCYDILRKSGYAGWVSLEYEGPMEPMPQLKTMKKNALAWL